MTIIYPAQIDTTITFPVITNSTPLNPTTMNTFRSAILAIENALGVNPAGSYGTVRARLDALNGEVGGDLTGIFPNLYINSIQGVVISGTPLSGQVLEATSSTAAQWTSLPTFNPTVGGDLSGLLPNPTVSKIQGNPVIPLNLTAAQDGYVLTWVNSDGYIEFKPIVEATSVTMGGDISGNSTTSKVAKLDGYVLSSPTPGVLQEVGGVLNWGAINLASSTYVTGLLPTANQVAQSLTLTGDITSSGGTTTSAATTLATVNGNIGSFGSTTTVPIITVNAKGLITAVSTATLPTSYPPNGSASGDLSGIYPNPTVSAIQGNKVKTITLGSSQDGYIATWVNSDGYIEFKPAPVGFSAGGDLIGTATNQTVHSIQGVVISGTPSANQVIVATSSSAAAWENSPNPTPIFVSNLLTTSAAVGRETIFVDGYSSQFDGGQGWFVWNSTSTLTSNIGTIIQVTGVSTGRWMRVYDQNIWVTWFGAKGDGVTDDSAAIQATINAAGTGGVIYFPRLPQYNTTFQSYLVLNPLFVLLSNNNNGITFKGDSPAGSSGAFYQVRLLFELTTYSGTTASITSISTIDGVPHNVTLSGLSIPSDVSPGDCITISNTSNTDGNGQLVNNGNFTITSVTPGLSGSGSVTYYGYNPQVNFVDGLCSAPDGYNGSINWIIRKNGILNLAEYTRFENITLQAANQTVGSLIYSTTNTTPIEGNTSSTFAFTEFLGGVFGINIGDIPIDGLIGGYPVGNAEFFLFEKCDFTSQLYAGVKNNGGEQKGQKFVSTTFQFQPVGLWFWEGSLACYDVGFEGNQVNIQLANPDDTTFICGIQAEGSQRMLVTGLGNASGVGGTTSYQCILENCRFDTIPASMSPDGYVVQWIFNGGLEMRNCEFSLGEGGFGSGNTPLTVCLTGAANASVANSLKVGAKITNCGFPNGPSDPIVVCSTLSHPFLQWESLGNYCNNGNGVDYPIPDGIVTINSPPVMSIFTNGGSAFSGTFTPHIGSNIIVASVNQSQFSGNPNPIIPGMYLTFLTVGAGSFLVDTISNTTPCNIQISTSYPAGYPGDGYAGTAACIIGAAPAVNQQLQLVTPITTLSILDGYNTELQNNGFYLVELTGGGASAVIAGMVYVGVNGQHRKLINITGSPFIISHENTSELAPWNRFHNPVGTDITVNISAEVYYSASLMRWVITNYQ